MSKENKIKLAKKPNLITNTPTDNTYQGLSQSELLSKVRLLHEQITKINEYLLENHRVTIYDWSADDTGELIVELPKTHKGLLTDSTLKLRGGWDPDTNTPELKRIDFGRTGWLFIVKTTNMVKLFDINWSNGDYAVYDAEGKLHNVTLEMLEGFNKGLNQALIENNISNHNTATDAHEDLLNKKLNIISGTFNTDNKGRILVSTDKNDTVAVSEIKIADYGSPIEDNAATIPTSKMVKNCVDTAVNSIVGKDGAINDATTVLEDRMHLTLLEKISDLKGDTETKYAKKEDITAMYKHEGTVDKFEDLPPGGALRGGVVYNVIQAYGDNPAGTAYTWNDTKKVWEPLGGTVDLTKYITKTETIKTIGDITQQAYLYADELVNPLSEDYYVFKSGTNTKISAVELDLNTKQPKLIPAGGLIEIDKDNKIKVNIDIDNYPTTTEVETIANDKATTIVNGRLTTVVTPLANDLALHKNATDIAISGINSNLSNLQTSFTTNLENLNNTIQGREVDLEVRVLNAITENIGLAKVDIDKDYAKKTDISSAFTPVGSYETYELLVEQGTKKVGNIYTVNTAHGNSPAFTNYLWNAAKDEWEPFGGLVDLSNYETKEGLNTKLTSLTTTLNTHAESVAQAAATEALEDVPNIISNILTEEVERLDTAITNNYNELYTRTNEINDATITYMWENTYKKDNIDDLIETVEEEVTSATDAKLSPITTDLAAFKTASTNRLDTLDEAIRVRPILEGTGKVSVVGGKIQLDLSDYDTAADALAKATTAAGEVFDTKVVAVKTGVANDIAALDSTIATREANLKTQLEGAITNNINLTKTEIAGIYAKKVDAGVIYTPKGSKDTFAQLVAEGEQVTGNIYIVKEKNGTTPANSHYTWNAEDSVWEPVGGLVDLSNYITSTALNTRLAGFDEEYKGHAETLADAVQSQLDNYKSTTNTAISDINLELGKRPVLTGSGKISISGTGVVSVNLNDYDTKTAAETKMNDIANTKANAVLVELNTYKTSNNTAVSTLNTKVDNIPVLTAGDGISIVNGKIKATVDLTAYAKTVDVETLATTKATQVVESVAADIVTSQLTDKLGTINSRLTPLETFKTNTTGTLTTLQTKVEAIPEFDEEDFEIDPVTKKVRTKVQRATTYTIAQTDNKFLTKASAESTYVKKLEQGIIYRPRGSVNTYADLLAIPVLERNFGDVYNVINADPDNHILAGSNFVWVMTGSREEGNMETVWDNIGGTFDTSTFAKQADTYTKTEVTNAINTKATQVTTSVTAAAYAYTDQKIAALPAGGSGGGSSLTPKITQASTSGLLVLNPNKHYYLTAQDGDFMIQLNTDGEVSGSDNEYMLDVYFENEGFLGVTFDITTYFIATNAELIIGFDDSTGAPGILFAADTRLSLSIVEDTVTLYQWEKLF